MKKQPIIILGREFSVPGYYQQVDPISEGPEGAIPLMVQTEQSICFVLAYHISTDEAMPYDQKAVIDAIHGFLMENQGLIEVNAGTLDGSPYVYSIVKSLNMEGETCLGVQYILAMDIAGPDGATHFQGQFEEAGMTGLRDATCFELCQREGLVSLGDEGIEGWNADPYNPSRTEGALMNLSERSCFDEMFPAHPLSMARAFVTCVLGIDIEPGNATGQ